MDVLIFPPDHSTRMTLDAMNTVSKRTGQTIDAGSAANADQIGEDRQVGANGVESSGWDAYDVWRRFIKEARDRRKSQNEPS